MVIQLSNKKIIACFIYIISLIALVFTSASNVDDRFQFLVIFSIILLAVFLISRVEKLVSFTTFFIIFLYIYNCGQAWILLFDYDFETSSFLITQYTQDYINSALFFFLIIMCCLQLLLTLFDEETENSTEFEVLDDSVYSIQNDTGYAALRFSVGIAYIICILVLAYNDTIQILSANVVGYTESYTLGRSSSLVYMMINIFPLLVGLGIFVFEGRRRNFIIVHAIVRAIAMMILVGNRGMYLAILCMMFIMLLNTPERLREQRRKSILPVLAFGVVIVVLAGYVADIRNVTSGKIGIIEYLLTSNIFFEVFQELGGTLIDTILLIKNVPENLNWGYGISYIGGVIQFVPRLSSLLPGLCKYNSIGDLLNNGYFAKGSGLGGSFIGELYLNFGWGAIVFLPLFFKVIQYIEKVIMNVNSSNLKKGICYYAVYAFFMYARGDFSDFAVYARYLCYFLLFYYIVLYIFRKRNGVV